MTVGGRNVANTY